MGRDVVLLDAASRRFVAVGIAKTTMEEIAREAGAGKATLYRYFPNKTAVVDALLERESDRFAHRLRQTIDERGGAIDRVEAAFVEALMFLRTHPVLDKSLREEPELVLPYLTARSGAIAASVMGVFVEVIAEGVASGELRPVRTDWAAETLFRLVMSFVTLPTLGVRLDDPRQVDEYAHALVAGALARRDQ